MKHSRIWLFLAAVVFIAGRVAAQSPAPVTLVKAGRLLDPRTGNILSPAAVLIDAGKIKEVGTPAQVQAPSGAKIIDLGNATLLPGFIDGHTHLLLDVVPPAEVERGRRYNGGFVPDLLLAIVESNTVSNESLRRPPPPLVEVLPLTAAHGRHVIGARRDFIAGEFQRPGLEEQLR